MAIDQSPLGNHTQELMESIENDPEIPDGAQLGRLFTIVEVVSPDGQFSAIRFASNARPYVAIGFLELMKEIQMQMMLGGGGASPE